MVSGSFNEVQDNMLSVHVGKILSYFRWGKFDRLVNLTGASAIKMPGRVYPSVAGVDIYSCFILVTTFIFSINKSML